MFPLVTTFETAGTYKKWLCPNSAHITYTWHALLLWHTYLHTYTYRISSNLYTTDRVSLARQLYDKSPFEFALCDDYGLWCRVNGGCFVSGIVQVRHLLQQLPSQSGTARADIISIMSDSEQTGTEDSTSVNSKISTTVTIFCSCNKQSCCAFWCGKFNSYWRLLTLGTLVVMYLAMGALIFSLVEGPNERRQVEMVQQERAQALDELTIKVQDLTNLSQAEARNVTIAIIALGVAASRTIPAEENPIWDYSSAFFFSSTVITTIGKWNGNFLRRIYSPAALEYC